MIHVEQVITLIDKDKNEDSFDRIHISDMHADEGIAEIYINDDHTDVILIPIENLEEAIRMLNNRKMAEDANE